MEKTAILFSVLLLGWTWTLQGVAADDDQVKTTESTVVPADAEGATVNTTVHDATEHSTTLNNATDAALIRALFNATDICNAPPERGQCMAFFKYYFYNSISMSCEIFTYGGCGGNRNNFKNKKECMQSCHPEEVCNAPPETGPCKAHTEHYFYNSISKSCEKFVYGGCLGNHNNFKDERECMQRCHPEEVCNAPPETGPCKAHIEHYFYNSTSKSCEKFVYGGCLGNQNNFKDETECMQRCHPEEICVKAPETGPCKAYIERYFYNSTSKSCEKFVYGGCLGNRNNFKDEKACMQRCHTKGMAVLGAEEGEEREETEDGEEGEEGEEVCNAPPETGPCKAHTEHYFYNSTSKSCGKFVYGGCLSNHNNFKDETE
ncbi:actinia tenebrosa protease inhibitors-like [Epinephelus lanceolatus]